MAYPSSASALFNITVPDLLAHQRTVLEQVAAGVPLSALLQELADVAGGWSTRPVHVAALVAKEQAQIASIESTSELEGVEKCVFTAMAHQWEGAASKNQTVAVMEILEELAWAPCRKAAQAQELCTCWSVPAYNTQGAIVGFAVCYLSEKSAPNVEDIATLTILAQTIALAIYRSEALFIMAEKRRAEQQLRANEARLRLALEAGEMGAWEMNPMTGTLIWLQGDSTMKGIDNYIDAFDMPMGNYVDEYVHPDDRESVRAVFGQAMADGQNHSIEYRIVLPDGSVHWIEGRGARVVDTPGELPKLVGVCTNITLRKRAEHDLKFLANASAELASLVDPQSTLDRIANLAVPFFADWCVIDLVQEDGSLSRVTVAHADKRMVQLAREFHRQFPPDPKFALGAWKVLRSGKPQCLPEVTDEMLQEAFKEPSRLAVMRQVGVRSYIAVPLTAHGKTLGVATFLSAESGRRYGESDVALAEDLARRAGVALENADLYRAVHDTAQSKDIFLATLSHELRNPLAAIVSGLNLLTLAQDDKTRVIQCTNIMKRQADQLTRLVDDLMDVSRIATGKIELKKQDVSLHSVVEAAVEASRGHIDSGRHELRVQLPEGVAMVSADSVRLTQVLTNLLTNAAKYTNAGGQICLTAEYTTDEYLIRVRDTGIGIAQEMLKDIFKMFTQVTHPIQRSQGGLGIGLALVDGLVKLHGGRVEAFSAGTGQGSEFIVRLPRETPREAEKGSSETLFAALTESPARRVLVVDDNVDAALTIAEIIRILGHEVEVAHDGLSAVQVAGTMRPDIVFLDIGLPHIDGYEAARRIRLEEQESGRARTALIALTGWGQADDKERAAKAGFDQHLVKPASIDQLTKILNQY